VASRERNFSGGYLVLDRGEKEKFTEKVRVNSARTKNWRIQKEVKKGPIGGKRIDRVWGNEVIDGGARGVRGKKRERKLKTKKQKLYGLRE